MAVDNLNRDQLEHILETLEAEFESYAPDEAVDKAVEVLHLSFISSHSFHEGRARFLLGISLRRMGKLEESIAELQEALHVFCSHEDTNERCILCLFELANTYHRKQEFLMAQKYYEQVIDSTVGKSEMQSMRGNALVYLASTLYYLGNIPQARITYMKALAVVQELGDPNVVVDVYLGLGWMHFEDSQLEEAIHATERAKAESQLIGGYRMSNIMHNLGSMYLAQGRYDEAYEAWQYCMRQYRRGGSVQNQVSLYEELASYFLLRDNLDEAEKCCEEAVKLLGTQEDLILRGRIYRFLAEIQERRGNLVFAREYCRISLGAHEIIGALHEMEVTRQKLQSLENATKEGGIS